MQQPIKVAKRHCRALNSTTIKFAGHPLPFPFCSAPSIAPRFDHANPGAAAAVSWRAALGHGCTRDAAQASCCLHSRLPPPATPRPRDPANFAASLLGCTQHQGTFTAIHYCAARVARFLSLTQAQAISPGPRTKTLSPTCVDPTRGTASPTHTHTH